MNKESLYQDTIKRINLLIKGETDIISKMSTITCELFHAFDSWNWVGFYRMVDATTLKVGPYQGTHGCLTIDINQGVCGKCARDRIIQIENNVKIIPHHITCSEDTESEIVIPIMDKNNILKAVLDIDSFELNNFDEIDKKYLTQIALKIY